MPGYAKFMKDLVTQKRSMNFETIKMTHQVSAIVHSMDPKLEDPGGFTILCTIGSAMFAKSLCDHGTSIYLIPYLVFKTLGIGEPRPTSMRLQMADCTMKRPLGVIEDVLVRVDKFILLVDFVILDCEVDYEVPIILGRPFLAMGQALVNVEAGELTFRVGDKKVIFHVCKSIGNPIAMSVVINVDDTLEAVLLNIDDEEIEDFVECVNSFQEPPILELKPLPPHLRYEFLGPSSTLPVILSSYLTNVPVDSTLAVLQKRRKAIGWTLADIQGINPAFFMHNINLEKGGKPSIAHQMRLNEAM
ncbi:uncharacterized protein [Nicotiana sylvestris]|uniref:uncharacterized protein n=1 Tax=Nicotiana sylvestris TaxID=4096 RepID=UPI00388CE1E3